MRSFFCFGLLMGFIWSTWTISSISAAFCKCSNITLCEQQCNKSGEIHSLSCFGKRHTEVITNYFCTWSPGKYEEYFLYVKQRTCRPVRGYSTITTKTDAIAVAKTEEMKVFAIALSDDRKTCAYANFSGRPLYIIQCGPPSNVTFRRSFGHMNITAKWDDSNVEQYLVKYREHNTTEWKQVTSQNSTDCIVGDVVSSQSYEIQIQCVTTTDKCPQCPLSEVIKVPQELVDAPVIKKPLYKKVRTGQRKITLKWEYVHSQAVEDYTVTVQKASGELATQSSYVLKKKTVTLVLCYSAYNLSIIASNKAGPSPAAHLLINAVEDLSGLDRALNVTLNSNTSFTLFWNETLSMKYQCYSVEWWTSNEKVSYETFDEQKNYHTIQTEKVAFRPYKRYHFFLHARHEKETCNLKKVNHSDETLGKTQVYLTEGTPEIAPGNVSSSNITRNSFVIRWSSIPEKKLQGFLKGYIIKYMHDNSQKNFTVPPNVNSYELLNLWSGTTYCVELSAYTAKGEGKWSESCFDTLDSVAIGGMLAGVTAAMVALLLATHLCFWLLKRSKSLLWPSIPNPYNSNAVQKIEGAQELEVMELLCRPNLEQTEEHVSVLEAKKETHFACNVPNKWTKAALMPDASPSSEDNRPPLSPTTSLATDSTPNEAFPTDTNPKGSIEDLPEGADNIKDPASVTGTVSVSTAVANPASALMSDYTTMELFQQITKGTTSAPSSSGAVSSDPGQDYLRQSLSKSEDTRDNPEHTWILNLTDRTINPFPQL